jgi:hypothetical protein
MRSCMTRRACAAPIAARSAISRARAAFLAKRRLATLLQGGSLRPEEGWIRDSWHNCVHTDSDSARAGAWEAKSGAVEKKQC